MLLLDRLVFVFERWLSKTKRFFCLFCFIFLRNPFGCQLPSCSVGLHTEKFVYFILNHVIQIFVVIFRDEFHRLKSLPKATHRVTWRILFMWVRRPTFDPSPQSPGGPWRKSCDVWLLSMPCAHLHPLGLTPKLPEAGVDLPTLGIKLQFLVQFPTELTGRILEDVSAMQRFLFCSQ